jgi:N6-adenosine-specific RNA methylase IME4/ParB-like chromosome segregation protein Spo0J
MHGGMAPANTLAIAKIKVGVRHRRDMGDLAGLSASIAENGLLHPIVITPHRELIAGERRLKACAALGWTKVPITVVDLDEIARGERDENFVRKDFTPSEAVAIAEALAPKIKAEAKARQAAAGPSTGRGAKPNGGGNLPQAVKGKARDKAADFTGIAARTLAKAAAVVQALRADPKNERIQKLHADMDRTGNVHGPFKRLKVMLQSAAIRAEPPPLPNKGPYRVIIADPPWPYELRSEDPTHRATHPYPQMSIEAICAVHVASIAHEDSVLGLWTTNHHMRQAFLVLDACGFVEKTILTWVKDRFGTGDWLRGQTEHCIIAVRGNPMVELTNQSTVLYGPLRANSQKPDELYPFIESLFPAPRYAYLFSRDQRERWDMHGDEAGHGG